MQAEVGSIVDGKVMSIAKFGAFVDIGGVTGMIHISEVAPTYVQDIRDYLTEGQEVRVKVLSVSPEGKIALSLKQAATPPPQSERPVRPQRTGPRPPRDFSRPVQKKDGPEPGSFEDMMSRFKASSDDKLGDLKRRSNSGAVPRPRGKEHHRDD